jgi:hypothetical protein
MLRDRSDPPIKLPGIVRVPLVALFAAIVIDMAPPNASTFTGA